MPDPSEETLRQAIVQVLTTRSVVELEQGRSFPMSRSEAEYSATCLLADEAFRSAVGL